MNATRKNVFFFSLLVLVSLFQSPHAFLPVPIVSRLHSFTSISTTSATTTSATTTNAGDADHRGGGGDNVDTMMEIPLPIESRPFLARPPREQNHDCHDNNAFFFTRRNVISTILLSSSSSTCCYSFLQPSLAASIPTLSSQGSIVGGGGGGRLAESIRQSAAKLPGYGQPDVYYPASFLGRWRVTRMIVSMSECNPLLCLNQQQQASSFLTVPFVLSHDARFIAVGSGTSSISSSTSSSNGGGETMGNEKTLSSSRSSSKNDESGNVNVISDRAFNLASFYSAFKSKLEEEEKGQRKNDNTQGKVEEDNHMFPSIQKIEWSTSNPNTCTIYYSDGSWKEIRVTKRATELDVEQGTVFSSEYARVSTVSSSSGGGGGGGGAGGIPLVQGVRVLTKWKISKEEKMEEEEEPVVVVAEGIEVVYLDDAGSATFSNSGGGSSSSSGSGSANVVMKSRLKLERI